MSLHALPLSSPRSLSILDTAHQLFATHGYQKTSMDDIARGAGVSRQCVYLHFNSKEALFKASVIHFLESALLRVSAALHHPSRPLRERLIDAMDELPGRQALHSFQGRLELISASFIHVGKTTVDLYCMRFDKEVAKCLTAATKTGEVSLGKASAIETAEVLRETSSGIAAHAENREAFRKGLKKALKVILSL